MATRRKKKQTLSEFRAWLGGVEELQPEDWAPDATQWKLIREKIDNVIEPKNSTDIDMLQKLIESIGKNTGQATNYVQQSGGHYPAPAPIGIPPAPQTPGGVPTGPVVQAPAGGGGTTLPAAQPVDIAASAKPNLDTTDGNYSSTFG